ncbi:hypothetical protein EH171_05360 [Enterovibrio baiacu]|nr:hypothetical protein [Enterovibrio baiacu]
MPYAFSNKRHSHHFNDLIYIGSVRHFLKVDFQKNHHNNAMVFIYSINQIHTVITSLIGFIKKGKIMKKISFAAKKGPVLATKHKKPTHPPTPPTPPNPGPCCGTP